MYKIKLTNQAKKEFKKLKALHQLAIGNILEELKDDPLLGKPLTRELTGMYSYKLDVYRIIYKINKKEKIITILTAGHRAVIYSK